MCTLCRLARCYPEQRNGLLSLQSTDQLTRTIRLTSNPLSARVDESTVERQSPSPAVLAAIDDLAQNLRYLDTSR